MDKKPLLDYTSKELLDKFGKGGHKPGSGSAVAFQGLLALQLLHTVITITKRDDHKLKYEQWLPDLMRIDDELINSICPSLESLFQKDAILFDKVIEIRQKAKKEKNVEFKHKLNKEALEALKPATEILIEIADKCADVADHAAFVFDNAFKSAKGDSGVALNGAVAALAGCLSIIDLNLSSFGSNDWTVRIRGEVGRLRTDYKKLSAEASHRMDTFAAASRLKSFKFAKEDLNSGRWEGNNLSESAIESLADQSTNLLWDFRDLIWVNNTPKSVHEILKPEAVIEQILGYRFEYAPLGISEDRGSVYQIAGQINKKERVVMVSNALNQEVRNFTAAHELGHALLHRDMEILHRDRPLDGSIYVTDLKERQANKFAACFLMPARTVREVFQLLFSMDKFVINQNTVFQFGGGQVSEFKRRYPTLRHLSRFVAKFQGKSFKPLHQIFGVSVEAMAIRLEEVGLVE